MAECKKVPGATIGPKCSSDGHFTGSDVKPEMETDGEPGRAVDIKVQVRYSGHKPDLGTAVWFYPPTKGYPDGRYRIRPEVGARIHEPWIVPASIVYLRDGTPIVKKNLSSKANKAMNDPHRLARIYLRRYSHQDGCTLRYWNQEWYEWNGSHYRIRLREEIRSEINKRCEEEFDRLNLLDLEKHAASGSKEPPPVARAVTVRLVSDVESAIKSIVTLPVRPDGMQSQWIDNSVDWPISEIVPARNAIIRLDRQGNLTTIPPTPKLFTTYAVPYDYLADAPEPVELIEFLKSIWGNDQDAINTLQEWFGYSLVQRADYQKMLMLVGPKRSGKGTIAKILGDLVGRDNVAGPTVKTFSESFGMSMFLGKLVGVISDARLQGRNLASHGDILERLLTISGGDEVTINIKFKQPVTSRLTIKIMFLSNDVPEFDDSSGAIVDRFIYLKLVNSFLGREDIGLHGRLVKELPSILLWSVAGLQRLIKRGHFQQPHSGITLHRQMSNAACKVRTFVEQYCDLSGDVFSGVLFDEWKLYCLETGDDPGTSQKFGKNLYAAFPEIEAGEKWCRERDRKQNTYKGISIRQHNNIDAFNDQLESPSFVDSATF